MFDPNTMTTQQSQQVQYGQAQQGGQQVQQTDSKELVVKTVDSKGGQQSQQQTFPSFCYATNVNMIHKKMKHLQNFTPFPSMLSTDSIKMENLVGTEVLTIKYEDAIEPSGVPQSTSVGATLTTTLPPSTTTVNMSQLTDDKCYAITQPFSYNYALVNQMSLAQTTNITFKCDVCGLMFAHLQLLNHHKRIHQQQDVSQGQQAQQVQQGQQQGQQQQQQQQQQQITVQVVMSEHDVAQQAPQQIQIVSADRIRYSCEECGLTYATQTELKAHKIQSHQPQQQQQQQPNTLKIKNCESCGAPLPLDSNKKRAVMKVKCETCLSAEAIQQQQPQQIFVVATTAQDGAVKFEQAQVQQEQSSTGTQTGQAVVAVKSAPNNNTPVTNHHPVKRRGIASVTKCTKCNGSGIIFIGGAKNQQANVDKPFHCNICNGSFSRYSSLWSHKRLHTGEKNFKCNICGLAFAKAAYLKNHSRIHTGEKPYRCGVCGMQFSQSPHLKNHERIHSGERPYVCEVCDKSFARHSTLWNHRRIHTGEKPYRCDVCGSCFNQATHLKNHAKVHSGEKPFKCDICTVGFSDRFALKRHRNIHEKYGRTKPAVQQVVNTIMEEEQICDEEQDLEEPTEQKYQVHHSQLSPHDIPEISVQLS